MKSLTRFKTLVKDNLKQASSILLDDYCQREKNSNFVIPQVSWMASQKLEVKYMKQKF